MAIRIAGGLQPLAPAARRAGESHEATSLVFHVKHKGTSLGSFAPEPVGRSAATSAKAGLFSIQSGQTRIGGCVGRTPHDSRIPPVNNQSRPPLCVLQPSNPMIEPRIRKKRRGCEP